MNEARVPVVAGSFYPIDARQLRAAVRGYLASAHLRLDSRSPKAIISPHAGYRYSGAIAGTAFASLAPLRGSVTRVVLVGPAHRVEFEGLAVPEARALATPLGILRVDAEGIQSLLELPQVHASDRAHATEHSLEVELPFVQETLGDVAIVPIVVGAATDSQAAEALERVWGGSETCVVVSSDLSHYHPYESARRLDRATARAIERLAPDDVSDELACGHVGIRALLRVARAKGLRATTLDLKSSGDTGASRDRVVGYGAFCFA